MLDDGRNDRRLGGGQRDLDRTLPARPDQVQLGSETAIVSGMTSGHRFVALGAHLLQDGASVRSAPEGTAATYEPQSFRARRSRAGRHPVLHRPAVAAGVYAFVKLGRAEDPSFTIKTLTVTTAWPGATAREMQDLVAEPLEKRLQELTWYDRVETITRPGFAFMTVTLKDSTPPSVVQEEFYQARKKLGDEARNLPPGVFGPFVNDEYSDVSFALYALKAKGMPMRDLVRQAEAIRQDLLHVPGVKKINILGERPERIFVEFSYAKLATLGVSRTGHCHCLATAERRHAGRFDRHPGAAGLHQARWRI